MRQPELSVVVASHDRPLRLRWLLNSPEQQTLDRALWEVVVCHDSRGPETDELLEAHGLTADGTLRWTSLPAGTAPPGANRNAALALACAPVLVFTDDDCRPPPEWLEHVRGAVQRHPGSIIQGPVAGDPDEQAMRRAPHPRTQAIELVPTPWAECCNIVYPRALVARVGGFDPHAVSCEDTDLARRALAAGRDLLELPGWAVIDAAEIVALVRGSIRERVVVL